MHGCTNSTLCDIHHLQYMKFIPTSTRILGKQSKKYEQSAELNLILPQQEYWGPVQLSCSEANLPKRKPSYCKSRVTKKINIIHLWISPFKRCIYLDWVHDQITLPMIMLKTSFTAAPFPTSPR